MCIRDRSAADTIARDGHIANKIGTFQISILAKYFGIPYYVTGIPDEDKMYGKDIIIEERDPAQEMCIRDRRWKMKEKNRQQANRLCLVLQKHLLQPTPSCQQLPSRRQQRF